jgi:hypothetical protein
MRGTTPTSVEMRVQQGTNPGGRGLPKRPNPKP